MDARRRRRLLQVAGRDVGDLPRDPCGQMRELGQVGRLVLHDGARDPLVPRPGGLPHQLGGGEVVQLLAGARGPDPLGQLEHAVERRRAAFRVAHHEDVRARRGRAGVIAGNLGKQWHERRPLADPPDPPGRRARAEGGHDYRSRRGLAKDRRAGKPSADRPGAPLPPERRRRPRGGDRRAVRHRAPDGCAVGPRLWRTGMAWKRWPQAACLRKPSRRLSPAMPAMPVRSRSGRGRQRDRRDPRHHHVVDAEAVVQLVVRHGDAERAHRLRQQDLDQVDAAVGQAAGIAEHLLVERAADGDRELRALVGHVGQQEGEGVELGQAADVPVHAEGVVAVEPVAAARCWCRSASSAAGCRCAPRAPCRRRWCRRRCPVRRRW